MTWLENCDDSSAVSELIVKINGICLKSPFIYSEKPVPVTSCQEPKSEDTEKILNSFHFYNLIEHQTCSRASWTSIFALFTWKWFYTEELESFMGKREVCCLSLLIFLEDHLKTRLDNDGDSSTHQPVCLSLSALLVVQHEESFTESVLLQFNLVISCLVLQVHCRQFVTSFAGL